MRIVLDASVFVSALISTEGTPAQILGHWRGEEFDLVVSLAMLQELERVLRYPKLQQRYPGLSEGNIQNLLHLFDRQAIVASPSETLGVIERDPTDNRYLDCAVAGGANIIVSGDQHLLELGKYQDIQILMPAGFLAFLKLGS